VSHLGLPLTLTELQAQIALGEDSRRQFKRDIANADALAAEMAALANAEGGVIFLGVADDGSLPGLNRADVARLNQLISNAASQHVRSPLTVQTENIGVDVEHVLIALTIPKGLDKPYFDRNGVIWLKSGADKRRINSKEELRRLFQTSDQFHADELPTSADIEKLDKLRFRDFLHDVYDMEYPETEADRLRLLQNMNLATPDGFLNLAGVLLFAQHPQWIKPHLLLKVSATTAMPFPRTTIWTRKISPARCASYLTTPSPSSCATSIKSRPGAASTIPVFPKYPASCLKNCWSTP